MSASHSHLLEVSSPCETPVVIIFISPEALEPFLTPNSQIPCHRWEGGRNCLQQLLFFQRQEILKFLLKNSNGIAFAYLFVYKLLVLPILFISIFFSLRSQARPSRTNSRENQTDAHIITPCQCFLNLAAQENHLGKFLFFNYIF